MWLTSSTTERMVAPALFTSEVPFSTLTPDPLIEEISVAAQEQAGGVRVVNDAMNELDRSTQQNASLVNDLARSTDALTGSSSRLVESVGYFRT